MQAPGAKGGWSPHNDAVAVGRGGAAKAPGWPQQQSGVGGAAPAAAPTPRHGILCLERSGKWLVDRWLQQQGRVLKPFENEAEAAAAADRLLLAQQGSKAQLNFPLADYPSELYAAADARQLTVNSQGQAKAEGAGGAAGGGEPGAFGVEAWEAA